MTSCIGGFKPYYNWTAFNTASKIYRTNSYILCFKPCYKWNTFNTKLENGINDMGMDMF